MSIEQRKRIEVLEQQIAELMRRVDVLETEKIEIEGDLAREQLRQERIDLQTKPVRTRPRGHNA